MTIIKSLSAFFALILAVAVFAPAARADESNQRTELKFSQPIEIPGKVLPPGTYWFVLLNSSSNRNVVQIFNSSNSRRYATLDTVPTLRKDAGDTEVVLAERHHSRPEALWKWYYPGSQTGHEFLYPTREENNLRRDAKQDLTGVPPLTVRYNHCGKLKR
jgi:hypothetical protein